MILPAHRKIARTLCQLRIWRIEHDWLWGTPRLRSSFGSHWLLKRMTRMQTSDGLHHAPACSGNEWDGQNLVIQKCTCGAKRHAVKKVRIPQETQKS